MQWLPWVLFPVIGASIGYVTNWIAIRMLFRPRERRWGMQGLLPRRQQEIGRRVGQVVARDLVLVEEMLEPIKQLDLSDQFRGFVDKIVADKVGELKQIPLLGNFITPELLNGLRDRVVRELNHRQGEILDTVGRLADEHIDIAGLVEQKIAALDLDRLEAVVNEVARRELWAIEIWGGVLGFVVGLVQAALLVLIR